MTAKELNAAIKFMSNAVKSNRSKEFTTKNHWDTYANLLYKAGRVKEAISWQEKTIEAVAAQQNPFYDKKLEAYKTTLDQMKRAEPTGVDQGAIWTAATLPK